MRLTPRRRAVIAVLVSLPIGWVYFFCAYDLLLNLVLYYHGSAVRCDHTWNSVINACNNYDYRPVLGWVELLGGSGLAVAIAYGLARWVAHPIGGLAEGVARFGPNSLGLRLRADGPRDETRRLADAIDAMLDRLAEGYEAQRRFAANASHELRTPLATQRALIEVSLGDALTPSQLELVSRQLLATNERNEQIIDGLLTLAETEGGVLGTAAVRWDAVVADAVEAHQRAAKEREIDMTSSLAPLTVTGELPLLERLIANLLSNAVKYNEVGGTVDVRLADDGALTVSNSGPVVPPDRVAALFEPFTRLAGERLDHGGGVGLGLTIARSITTAHGGSIEACAPPDGGLQVTVRLRPS